MTAWKALHALIEPSAALPPTNPNGLAIYYYLLYQSTGDALYLRRVQELFEQQLATINVQLQTAVPVPVELPTAALAWIYDKLRHEAVLSAADVFEKLELFEKLDYYLLQQARQIIYGDGPADTRQLLQIVRYYLERLPDAAAAACLQDVVAAAYGTTRRSLAQTADPVYLGLANGLIGELLILIDVCRAGIQPELLGEVVREGIAALLSTKREVDFLAGRYSVFPDVVEQDWQHTVFSNHLSWRHGGDLGAALLLYKAQLLLGDAELGRIAELVGLNTLLRTDPETTALTSSQFCQGTAGVAYLYHQLHALSGHAAYQQGYRYWLTRTEQCLAQELAAGYYHTPDHAAQCGALGVGIVLLALAETPARRHVAAVELA